MKKIRWSLAVIVVLGVIVACSGDSESGKPQAVDSQELQVAEIEKTVVVQPAVGKGVVAPTATPAGPKTLVICQAEEPDTLYFYGSTLLAARHIQQAIYDGLAGNGGIDSRSYAYQPVILEKLPSIEDGDAIVQDVTVQPGEKYVDEYGEVVEATQEVPTQQVIATFKLKKGILWEDGKPVTAHDSVYSFNLLADPDTPVFSKFTVERTASYKAPDDLTVQWAGRPGFLDTTYFINFFLPLPEHAMGHLSAIEILESKFARDPLSYGPFTLEEWVPGDHITLKKNSNYFRADKGLPKVDTVIFRFIPDSDDLLDQLLAGECHIGTQDGLSPDQAPIMLQAESQGNLQLHFVTSTVWEHLDFNIFPVDDRIPFGACLAVRQAVAYGTDRQAMIDQVFYGKSKVRHSFIPEEHPMYWADIRTYEFDPDRAKSILEEAGWQDQDGDGIREAHNVTCERVSFETHAVEEVKIPDGTPLQMTLSTTSGNKIRERMTPLFQQNMKDIGIDIELELVPDLILFADGPEGPLFGRRFDLAEFAWWTGVQPPGSLYLCSQVPTEAGSWRGQNETGWCAPEFEGVTSQALDALMVEEQKQLWAESQRIFAEHVPVLPLFARVKVAATSPTVTGFVIDPTESSEIANIEEFDIQR